MSRTTAGLVAALALATCAACEKRPPAAPAMLDAHFPDGRFTIALDQLANGVALPDGENIAVAPLARDATSSHQLVAIRDAEQPHLHARHDLTVVVLRGHGTMLLGASVEAVGEGSVLYVPRGVVHAFRNAGDAPAVAYTIFTPPFDGRDRVPVRPPVPTAP